MPEEEQQMPKFPRVLAVNDDPAIRKMLVEVLSLEGFIVETAADGNKALVLLEQSKEPHVLILDDRMPVMDGLEVLEVLATRPALTNQTGCIFVTGRSRSLPPELAQLLTQFQAPILSCPFSVESLLRSMEEASARALLP